MIDEGIRIKVASVNRFGSIDAEGDIRRSDVSPDVLYLNVLLPDGSEHQVRLRATLGAEAWVSPVRQ